MKKWVCLEERWDVLVTEVVYLDREYKHICRHRCIKQKLQHSCYWINFKHILNSYLHNIILS